MPGPASNQDPSMGSSTTKLQRDNQPCDPFESDFHNTDVSPRNEDDLTMQDGHDHLKPACGYTHEVELGAEALPDVLADGSLNFFTGVMEFYESDAYAKYKIRKHREKCKKSGEELWSSKAEALFLQITMMIPPIFGKTKINCKTLSGEIRSQGRNQLIADLMERYNPPVKYDRKKISSHKQVVKKLVESGGNQAALERIESDPRIVSAKCSKDLYFDEASMTLRAGEIRHDFSAASALSRFVPDLQLFGVSVGTNTPMVHSVEFNMGVYQRDTLAKDSTARLIHSCTTLQTPGGATAKPFKDIMPFIHLYPSLQDILDHDSGCDILWFDSSIDMLEQMPTMTSHIGIEFKVDMLFAKEYTDWKFKTNFYHHSGQLSHEIVRILDAKPKSDAKVNIEISLFSAWWVKLFQSRILKRQEAGSQYRKQLEKLQHGPCTCKACLHLCAAIEDQITAADGHCRAYFQDMSIMQSIYARPQRSQEHRCVAIFLFKFSQSPGNQIPLTTWHRVMRPDNMETEMISEPGSILLTQSDNAIGPEDTEWQSKFSDVDQRNAQNNWHNGDGQNFDFSNPYLDGSCSGIVKVGNLPHSTLSAELNNRSGRESFESHPLTTGVIGQIHGPTTDTPEYSELACYQESLSRKSKIPGCFSSQARNPMRMDDLIYAEGSAKLRYHEMDPVSFNDFSLEIFDETDQEMDTHVEALRFDFNEPLTIPPVENNSIFKVEPDDVTLHEMAGASGILSLEPRNVDMATNLLSPMVPHQEPERDDHDDLIRNALGSQCAQAARERDLAVNRYCDHDQDQEAIHEQHQNPSSKPPVRHSVEIVHRDRNDLSSLVYGVQQGNTYEQGNNSEKIIPVFPNLRTSHSDSPQRLFPVPLMYGLTENTEEDISDATPQNMPLDDFGSCSHEDHYNEIYHVPPTSPPGQDLPIATMVSYQENGPRTQQQPIDNSPDWSTSTDFDTHHWVIDLAIAKTEDMIEEAYANYADEQNVKAIQGVADVEAMAALLESNHQEAEFNCQEVAVHPSGKILGEIDPDNKCNIVEPKHHADHDSVSPELESMHADKVLKSQHPSRDGTLLSSTYFANDGFVSQALLRLEGNAALDIEWNERHPDYHATSFQEQIPYTQKGENSYSQAHKSLLADDSQSSLKDSYDAYDGEPLRTNYSTPEHEYQAMHYNSPQSVHSQLSNHNQPVSDYLYVNDTDYSSKRSRLTNSDAETIGHASISNEQNMAVFTPQSIEIEMSDADGEDLDLTERITAKLEEDFESQSQESYCIVKSESCSFSSVEQDKEWEKIEHEDVTTHQAPIAVSNVNANGGNNMVESHN